MLADPTRANTLAATHHLVVVLRLVVDTGGRVLHGELIERAADGRRFVGRTGLTGAARGAIADWLGRSGDPWRREADPGPEPTGTESGPVG